MDSADDGREGKIKTAEALNEALASTSNHDSALASGSLLAREVCKDCIRENCRHRLTVT